MFKFNIDITKIKVIKCVFFIVFVLIFFFWNLDRMENRVKKDPFRYGNLKGVKIKVEKRRIDIPFQYRNRTKVVENGYENNVIQFGVVAKYPEMEFVDASLKRKLDSHEVVRIAVSSTFEPDNYSPNGLAKRLNRYINKLNKSPVLAGPLGHREAAIIKYEYQGIDPDTNLHLSSPRGKHVELYHIWNRNFYWSGDIDNNINDLIKCHAGRTINNIDISCYHRFEFPEINAYVILIYSRKNVHDWKRIKQASKKIVLKFVQQ